MRWLLASIVIGFFTLNAQAGRPMTVDDLLAVKSVSDPQVSPDGHWVVYVVSEIDREANRSNSDLWIVPTEGGEPRRLTTAAESDAHPRWSPDGKTIAFTSSRGGSNQIWLLPLEGGEARQLTKLPIDVDGPIWSPKGDKIAFTAGVYPGSTPEETANKDKEKEATKANVRTFDHLMIRHWTAWDEDKRSHLFVADAQTGEARDLTPTWTGNIPPAPFGGSSDYAWAPDGSEIAFTSEPIENHAWSTNTDIWIVPADGGVPKNLTRDNEGADGQPLYTPDGKRVSYLSQKRAGFEADQWVLSLRDREGASPTYPTKRTDRSIQSFLWNPSKPLDIIAVIDNEGGLPIVEYTLGKGQIDHFVFIDGVEETRELVHGGVNTSVQMTNDGSRLVFVKGDAVHPAEVYSSKADGSALTKLTDHNGPLLRNLDLAEAESFTFEGAGGAKVQGWLVRPPGFDASKKYPVLFLIHGGPQGAWHDEWHARWNYQLFAAPGYAVVAINPRGSTGFGQEFTDQISQDWTGKVYEDLMNGLDHALKTYPFLDERRVAAAGGSYGGFMVNWIAGHSDRFKALVSHAGVFDLLSMYGTTEELWFPEWEFGGVPWEHPELYEKMSPSHYVENFRTPTLVLHGAQDFRVPDGQGFGMFTSLQRQGVPSRLVFFPDEGHWVLKPANRVVWWNEVHDWLAKYLSPKG